MEPLHHPFFRPAIPLVLVAALLATLACGATAEPDPIDPTKSSASASTVAPATNEAGNDGRSGQGTQGSTSADEVVINLPIANRDTTLTREDLRVSQGDTVRLELVADEEGEIHLHGYDLTAEVSPGHQGELVFVAATAGAFALNFHVFAPQDAQQADDHHGAEAPSPVASETPVGVTITAEPDAHGGVEVQIVTDGFRFEPELVDQAHTPGAGHAHIYVDGVKLGRVFDNEYHIERVSPGEHEIRVSLNSNDHREITFNGERVEATAIVTVPDAGQGSGDAQSQHSSDGHDHSHGTHGAREIIAEVHLGNLEVYP